jgi:hypothetical protein
VDLSEHVGHTVTVTGRVPQRKGQGGQPPSSMSTPDTTKEAAQAGGGQGGEGAGGGHMLFVTDLKMVSDSCKK